MDPQQVLLAALVIVVIANIVLIVVALFLAARRRRRAAASPAGAATTGAGATAASCRHVADRRIRGSRFAADQRARSRRRQLHGRPDRPVAAGPVRPHGRRRGCAHPALSPDGHDRHGRSRRARPAGRAPGRVRHRSVDPGRGRFDPSSRSACRSRGATRTGTVRHPAARDGRGPGHQLHRAGPQGVRPVAGVRRRLIAARHRLGQRDGDLADRRPDARHGPHVRRDAS